MTLTIGGLRSAASELAAAALELTGISTAGRIAETASPTARAAIADQFTAGAAAVENLGDFARDKIAPGLFDHALRIADGSVNVSAAITDAFAAARDLSARTMYL